MEIKCRTDMIPKERIIQITKEFADIQYQLEGTTDTAFLPVSYSMFCKGLVERLFMAISTEDERAQLTRSMINEQNPNTIAAACSLLIDASRPFGRLGVEKNNSRVLIDEKQLDALEGEMLAAISCMAQRICVFDIKGYNMFEHVWIRLDEEACRNHIQRLIDYAANIPTFLRRKEMKWSNGTLDFFESGEWIYPQRMLLERIQQLSKEELDAYAVDKLKIVVAFYKQAKTKLEQSGETYPIDAYVSRFDDITVRE